MENPVRAVRYAIRQFRLSPVFTAAAVLTLALGIGGTTAIFTLIHAVMLRSLPVSDPARLYRIGDGDDCCVEGGPQDRWGMFSFPLFERLKAETPEFEEVTAFQAGGARLSVRRQGVDAAARPLRSEYVTGNYFSTLGVGAFGGRVLTPDDDKPSAPPVVVLSHHVWQSAYGGDPSVVGSTFVVEGHPFTVIGVAPPGFFGETLRGDPPDLWIPLQQEPLIAGGSSLLRQPVSAWLRVIGRLRPGASVDGMAPRLTGVLRQWMQNDSGYPANWMPDVIRMLPKQTITVVPAGAGVGVMKEEYGRSLQILLGRLRPGAADCLRQRREPAARARGRAPHADRRAPGDRRHAARRSSRRRSSKACCSRSPAASPDCWSPSAPRGCCSRWPSRNAQFLPISTRPSLARAGVRVRPGAGHRHHLRRGAGLVRDADGSGRRAARLGPQHQRSLVVRAQGAARRAGHAVGRARRRRDDAGAQPEQARAPGFRLSGAGTRRRVAEPAAGDLHAAEARGALSRSSRIG